MKTGERNAQPLATIDWEHREVHHGDMSRVCVWWQAVTNNGLLRVFCSTASNKEVHIKMGIVAGGPAIIRLYEGTTMVANSMGTVLVPTAMNRCSYATSGQSIWYHTPTSAPTLGTLIADYLVVGETGASFSPVNFSAAIGGDARTGAEFVLADSRGYIVTITNTAGVTAPFMFEAEYYEEE